MSDVALADRVSSCRRFLAPDRVGLWEEARVVDVRGEADGVRTLRLGLPQVADFLPGQSFHLRMAIESRPYAIEQPYSASSSPWPPTDEIEITVREVPGGRVSPLLVREVRPGDLIQLRGPYGFLTWSEREGGPLMLIGAGSGVAPLVSIARYAVARDAKVPMTMLCSSRELSAVIFREEFDDLARRRPWFSVTHTLTRRPDPRHATYDRRIDAAMIAELLERRGWETTAVSFYVAGPAGMVAATRSAVAEVAGRGARLYSEDHT